MTRKQYNFGTIGVGGYAGMYLGATEYLAELGRGKLAAAVVRSPAKYVEKVAELEKKGVKFHLDLPSMLRNEKLDVVCVPTGISSHVPYSIEAMQHGYDVICEKPLCATVQEADELIEARDKLGKKIAIGYQGMYHPVAHELKRRLVAGELGKVKRIRCKISAPRHDGYYARNDWAGKLKGADGRWILDSPANNACAHQLQQMLFYAGDSQLECADPARIKGEMYHGRPDIDNADTCGIKIETTNGVEILYLVSHCVKDRWGPEMEVECENGTAQIGSAAGGGSKGGTFLHFADGKSEEISIETDAPNLAYLVFTNMVDALDGKAELLCTPDNSRQQTLAINAAHDSIGGPKEIPLEYTETGEVKYGSRWMPGRHIKGCEDAIAQCYEEWKLFSEIGVEWSHPSQWIEAADYKFFPGGKEPR